MHTKYFKANKRQNPEVVNELTRVEKEEEQEKYLTEMSYVTKTTNKTYDFTKFKTIRDFGDAIKNCITSTDIAKNFSEKFEEKASMTNINRKLISHIKQRSYIMRI